MIGLGFWVGERGTEECRMNEQRKHQTERDLIIETLHNMLCFVKHLLPHLVLEKVQRIFVVIFFVCQYITFLRLIIVSVSFKKHLSVF
jgi:hypothetical protein